MSNLFLTADQIYALAYIMKADYLDHYYISLSNKGDDIKLWQNETQKQLVSDGILSEDFNGDITVNPDVVKIIEPIFFGVKESSLDLNFMGENEGFVGYRFHFKDNNVTMTKTIDNGFEISSVNKDDINSIVNKIIPKDYSVTTEAVTKTFDVDSISRVIVVKSAEVDVKNYVESFVESDGVLYREDSDNTVYSVSGEDLFERIFTTLAEV